MEAGGKGGRGRSRGSNREAGIVVQDRVGGVVAGEFGAMGEGADATSELRKSPRRAASSFAASAVLIPKQPTS